MTLPPQPAGPSPIDNETLFAIRDAFVAAFDHSDPGRYEDESQAARLTGAGARYSLSARTIVDRVRLVDHDRAEVRFAFVLGPSPRATIPLEGVAVWREGVWKVAAETVARVLRMAGAGPDPGT